MKIYLFIIYMIFSFLDIKSQILTNQIVSDLEIVDSAEKTFRVNFTSNVNITGTEIAPMNIWLKIPDGEALGTSISYSGSFGFNPGFSFSSGGFTYYNFQSLASIPANTFQQNVSVNMGLFNVDGPGITVSLSGGDFGTMGMGSNWPGSAVVQGFDNLLTWPITETIILPIILKSFDAIKHSASSAKLDWTTSKEVNSDYFGIERSIDGSTWDEIARVKAAGDSNVDIAYDYIDDRLPLSRTNGQVFYYRLRMTDLDGAFKYSDVRGVNFDKQALGPISIYPNPTTEIVNIDLSEVVMEDGDVYVSVYDMSGRLVMTKQIIGSGIELIKVDQLPSDAYNFIIRQGEQIHQQRVIKID